MADNENQLELLKLDEESEMAMKKLKEANNKLKSIQKECSESITKNCDMKSELELLTAKGITFKRDVSEKIDEERILQAECEQKTQRLRKLSWQRQILAMKLKLEMNNRQHYENKMRRGIEPVNFMGMDRHEKQLHKMEDLNDKLDELKKEIAEKQRLKQECEESYAEAQKSINKLEETIRETKKNIENVEILINEQKEEFQKLSNNPATNR